MTENQLFIDLKAPRAEAQKMAIAALSALEPVFLSLAQQAPEDAAHNDPCWDGLYTCPEYNAAKKVLPYYLVHAFWDASNTIHSILDSNAGLSDEDLFMDCFAHVVTRLVKVYRNVHNRYRAKAGMVGKETGWLLYIQKMVSNRLIDLARYYSPGPRPKPAPRQNDIENLYEKAGQIIRSPEDLKIGNYVIRNSNVVGTFAGETTRSGIKYAQIEFTDGSTSFMRWDNVHKHIRLFSGDLQNIPIPKIAEDDDTRKPKNKFRTVPLDMDLNEEEDGFSLFDLIPGDNGCEDKLIENDFNTRVRNSYLKTIAEINGTFVTTMMLCVFINESLYLQKTHYPEIQAELAEKNPITLAQSIHTQNCMMLSIDPATHILSIREDSVAPSYSVRDLTLAKYRSKCLFAKILGEAMAA